MKGILKSDKTIQQIEQILPQGFFLAKTQLELNNIIALKRSYYTADRENVRAFHDDGLDSYAYVIYGTNDIGEITSTSRLLLDDGQGFPEESSLPESVTTLRNNGKKLAELGRLLIADDKGSNLRIHYKLTQAIALILGIDIVLIVMKQRNTPSHKKMMAVEILSMNMGQSWDEEQAPLCLVAWDVKAPQPKFKQWINRDKPAFPAQKWNAYSGSHLSAYLSVQKAVYQHIASRVHGRVLDLGCGTGRVMAYLQDNSLVSGYTGVDSSEAMIDHALWLKTQLHFDKAHLIHADIATIQGQYDCIYSIHSYYSWSEPDQLLRHIHALLAEKGMFILVTPNDMFDETRLAHLAKQELLGHPAYEEFMTINYAIASTAKAEGLYVPLDTLIERVKQAGFRVKMAHDQFFLGGASYLELSKAS